MLPKVRIVSGCCQGYAKSSNGTSCSPICHKHCLHGTCVAPNTCNCQHGFGGDDCSKCKTKLILFFIIKQESVHFFLMKYFCCCFAFHIKYWTVLTHILLQWWLARINIEGSRIVWCWIDGYLVCFAHFRIPLATLCQTFSCQTSKAFNFYPDWKECSANWHFAVGVNLVYIW